MGKLTVVNGQFVRDGQVVTPEFGNTEQIQAIKEYTAHIEALERGQLQLNYDIELKATLEGSFKCKCDTMVYIEYEDSDEDECISGVVGMTKNCRNCKTTYVIDKDEDDELIVKIKQ
jgi:hypothetical protein